MEWCRRYPEKCDANKLVELLTAVATNDFQKYRRDVGYHICLRKLYKTKCILREKESDENLSRLSLDRALEISERVCASGMVSWEKDGTSSMLDRAPERQLDILTNTAVFQAEKNDWSAAASTYESVLLRCEQNLPLYHPLTIVTLLDLSASLLSTNHAENITKASLLIHRANQRLSYFLGEQMQEFRYKLLSGREETVSTHRAGFNVEWLYAFASRLICLRNRNMARILGMDHPTVLLLDCFIGDALSVLATREDICAPLPTNNSSPPPISKDCESLWCCAGEHYRAALKGWVRVYGRRHPNVPSTGCSLSRCLWELNKREEAIEILSSVTGNLYQDNNSFTDISERKENDETEIISPICPIVSFQMRNIMSATSYEQAHALCLWMMAAYYVEAWPNNRGRMRALSLLHASAEALQMSLNRSRDNVGDKIKCENMLKVVESEAERLYALKI
eukprot:CAMPEP_0171326464 /NCGR_PEP_ID=MMETSP0816-20121228/117474_1 /TAXON_ID=420281 /ORGANISM="Proboscia inermis, Strain CCAP1064/1" /LENGTH=451 /DNA_ID=CAMNT_0011825951 /DNA_START=1374 /DNA_END=2729 /DNA_ORIENTATION=+